MFVEDLSSVCSPTTIKNTKYVRGHSFFSHPFPSCRYFIPSYLFSSLLILSFLIPSYCYFLPSKIFLFSIFQEYYCAVFYFDTIKRKSSQPEIFFFCSFYEYLLCLLRTSIFFSIIHRQFFLIEIPFFILRYPLEMRRVYRRSSMKGYQIMALLAARNQKAKARDDPQGSGLQRN